LQGWYGSNKQFAVQNAFLRNTMKRVAVSRLDGTTVIVRDIYWRAG